MSNDFISALDTEIALLEAALRDDPRWIKLTELKRVRDIYGRAPERAPRPAAPEQSTPRSIAPEQAPPRAAAPEPEKFFVNRPRGL